MMQELTCLQQVSNHSLPQHEARAVEAGTNIAVRASVLQHLHNCCFDADDAHAVRIHGQGLQTCGGLREVGHYELLGALCVALCACSNYMRCIRLVDASFASLQ